MIFVADNIAHKDTERILPTEKEKINGYVYDASTSKKIQTNW